MFARAPFPYRFHTRRGRSRRRHGKPETNRNIPSAFFGLVVTGLYAITMAEPNWFELDGGICSGRHIGLYTIFGMNIRLIKGMVGKKYQDFYVEVSTKSFYFIESSQPYFGHKS